MEHMVGINGRDGGDIGIGAGANFCLEEGKRYNGELFRVSLAGWSVACLNFELNG